MPRSADFQDVEIKTFSGLDLRGPAENLPDKSLQSLINFEVTDLGTLKSRPGFQQKYAGTSFANPVRFLGQFSTSTRNQIIVQTVTDNYYNSPYHGASGTVWKTSDGGVTWTQISPGTVTCGKFGQWNNASGITIPTTTGNNTWDGATWTTTTNGKYSSYNAWFHQDRFWVIENSTGNIWFSDPGNAASFPAANTIGFTLDNKDNIVGLQPYRDRMIVFFQNSIRVIYTNGPPSSWQMKFLPFVMGVRNQECYYVQNDLVYFLSSEGFYRTDLTQLEELSKPIAPVFQRRWEQMDLVASTWAKYRDAIGYWRGRFIISMRVYTKFGGSIPILKMLSYNIKNGAWSEIVPNVSTVDGTPYPIATQFLPVFVGKRLIAGSEYNKPGLYVTFSDPSGRVYIFDDEDPVYYDGTSNATNFSASFKTKEIDLDTPSEYKRSHTVSFRTKKAATGSSYSVKYNVNGVDRTPVTVANTNTLSTQNRIKGPGYFRKFNLELTDSSDQLVEIEGLTINVKKKGPLPEAQT